jgi:hypothetical protein
MTSWPSSTRRVEAASAARIVQPSCMPWSGGPDSRWSQTHTESRPTASACWAKVRTWGQVGTWPGPSEAAMGTTTPVRMPPSLGSRSCMLPETYLAPVGWFELVAALERAGDQGVGEAPPGVPIPAAPAGIANRQVATAAVRDRPWPTTWWGFCRRPLGYQRGSAGQATCSSLTMTASWEDGSPPVPSCPGWSTEPGAVLLGRPTGTVGGRG